MTTNNLEKKERKESNKMDIGAPTASSSELASPSASGRSETKGDRRIKFHKLIHRQMF